MATDLEQASPETARRLTDRIKVAVEGTWLLIQESYLTRAWSALGYGTWDEYCTREFGTSRLRLPREERAETVASLRQAGLSLRAIASATSVDEKTIRNDLSGAELPPENSAPDNQKVTNGNGQLGLDGKVYPPRPLSAPPAPTDRFGNEWGGPSPPSRPQPVMLSLSTHDGRTFPYPKPQAKATFNATDGEGISWAAWSWNPVTGCLHGCEYCYARAIAARWSDAYPAGFTPLFHHERLDAPANTVTPAAHRDDEAWRRVFVCSMADLYGRWVPDEWISQVHDSMLASPQWQYILLTKFPNRYPGLQLPPGAWVGTSVDEQKRVRIAENAFREISGVRIKWLSLEPLREPLEFTDLSVFDWVVIGAQTETRQPTGPVAAFAPPFEWVSRLVAQAREAGCKVHLKPNLVNGRPGMQLPDEYPA
jgi:protein gp37